MILRIGQFILKVKRSLPLIKIIFPVIIYCYTGKLFLNYTAHSNEMDVNDYSKLVGAIFKYDEHLHYNHKFDSFLNMTIKR